MRLVSLPSHSWFSYNAILAHIIVVRCLRHTETESRHSLATHSAVAKAILFNIPSSQVQLVIGLPGGFRILLVLRHSGTTQQILEEECWNEKGVYISTARLLRTGCCWDLLSIVTHCNTSQEISWRELGVIDDVRRCDVEKRHTWTANGLRFSASNMY